MNTERDELADEIIGWPIGRGYYSQNLGTDEAREIANAILAAGYRKPRIVTTVAELDTLPSFSVIHVQQDMTLEKLSDGWHRACIDRAYQPFPIWLPATVLYTQAETK